jgi:uncharacterized membrane protein
MSQSVNKAKAWNTPIWFMVVIFIFSCLQSLATLKITRQFTTTEMTERALFNMIFWPSLILAESIIYWMIRKRIKERKWVWAHLLFSLLAFVLLMILRILISFIILAYNEDQGNTIFRLTNTIEFYIYWSSLIIGHVFFVIAIVRSFSGKSAQLPHDDNDFLSEVAS